MRPLCGALAGTLCFQLINKESITTGISAYSELHLPLHENHFIRHSGFCFSDPRGVDLWSRKDHEKMQAYWLPKWSHMTGEKADRFTEAFYGLVQRELAAREVTGETQ